MKICFLIRSLDPAGAETQLVALANGLARRGHAVSVIVFYPGGRLESCLEGVELVRIPKSGRWDFAFLPRLVRQLRRLGPDIVHGYLGLGNLLAAVTRPFHRGATVWGVRASEVDLSRYGTGARLSFHAERACSRLAHGIVVNSHAGRDYAASIGYPADRMRVIPNGMDTARYVPSAEAGAAFRRELGLGPDDVLFGLVGRLDPMKGHDLFVGAAGRVATVLPNAHFVCVGGGQGEYAMAVRGLAASAVPGGRFHWLGAREDLVPVYNGLDVLVSASRYGEGFPNVVGEAMSCGTPCVVTDVGDGPLLVGESGRVVPPGDGSALAAAMEALAGRKGGGPVPELRASINARFSLERMIDASEAYFSEMVRTRREAKP